MTLNIAMVHHDAKASAGGRLVYGGHTIGIAAAQATRALPNLLAILAWHSCDHLAPVREGDTLRSTLELEACEPLPNGGGLVHLRSRVRAEREATEHAGRFGLAFHWSDGVMGIFSGIRVVEGSAFVAAPLCGMTLAQLGADVIRFDQIGGGLDYRRWPLAADGQSLFWAGLNKGKRSVQIDLQSREGRELATALITAPGEHSGLFLTNFPARGWLAYEALAKRRKDLVMVALTGNPDGTSEVDYTVNPATGFPWATGPRNLAEPLNSVLPAWDIALGTLATVGLLAAERHRRLTGHGQLVGLSLSDVAFAMVGNLGRIAEAQLGGHDQPKDGNYLYGAFGHDFETREGRRVMVVALTARQWVALKEPPVSVKHAPASNTPPVTISAPKAAAFRAAT